MHDKESIIKKIVSSPESLTDSDIANILADEELMDLYHGAVSMSQAFCDVPDFNTDESLAHLHVMMREGHRGFEKKYFGMSARRVAAIAVIFISLTALAIATAISYNHSASKSDNYDNSEVIMSTDAVNTTKKLMIDEMLQYDDAPLSEIIDDICAKYQCKAKYSKCVDKQSRLHFTIPAGSSLDEAISILNSFDEVEVSASGNTLIIQCPASK